MFPFHFTFKLTPSLLLLLLPTTLLNSTIKHQQLNFTQRHVRHRGQNSAITFQEFYQAMMKDMGRLFLMYTSFAELLSRLPVKNQLLIVLNSLGIRSKSALRILRVSAAGVKIWMYVSIWMSRAQHVLRFLSKTSLLLIMNEDWNSLLPRHLLRFHVKFVLSRWLLFRFPPILMTTILQTFVLVVNSTTTRMHV